MTTNNDPHTGDHLRGWRHRIGLTQEALAHALSVTFSTVSRWENGHARPSKLAQKAIERLARERGVMLEGVADDLVYEAGSRTLLSAVHEGSGPVPRKTTAETG